MTTVRRAGFVFVSALSGMALFDRGEDSQWEFLVMGFVIGGALGGSVLVIEQTLHRVPFGAILGAVSGLGIGLILVGLAEWVGSVIFDVDTFLFHVGGLALLLGLPYLGLVLGARFGRVRFGAPGEAREGARGDNKKILDTSVIIDGRIADLCETGFLEGPLLVPQFILQELHYIADSPDPLKRARGRRGLDVLNRIQKMAELEVRIVEDDFPNIKEVDSKIVVLAKKIGAKVITNDLNLNKVAELQGVRVLNINELCNALRPVVLPGEAIRVFILKEGKEAGQGVAYLDDGTMIVVDNAKRFIGRNVDVVVTSILQTTAGRMIFARLREETELKDDTQVARG
jgi:uncharacterized protein YacL